MSRFNISANISLFGDDKSKNDQLKNELQAVVDKLVNENKGLVEERETIKSTVKVYMSQISQLKVTIEELSAKLNDSESKMKRSDDNSDEKGKRVRDLESALADAQRKLTAQVSQTDKLQKKLNIQVDST